MCWNLMLLRNNNEKRSVDSLLLPTKVIDMQQYHVIMFDSCAATMELLRNYTSVDIEEIGKDVFASLYSKGIATALKGVMILHKNGFIHGKIEP